MIYPLPLTVICILYCTLITTRIGWNALRTLLAICWCTLGDRSEKYGNGQQFNHFAWKQTNVYLWWHCSELFLVSHNSSATNADWIKNWLDCCGHWDIEVNVSMSRWRLVDSGVLQASVLRLELFNVFIIDFYNGIKWVSASLLVMPSWRIQLIQKKEGMPSLLESLKSGPIKT